MSNYEYGLIGNCTSGALINKECSIEWLCLPYFDSPSLFGRLLEGLRKAPAGPSGRKQSSLLSKPSAYPPPAKAIDLKAKVG